jgi:hypothetical protein
LAHPASSAAPTARLATVMHHDFVVCIFSPWEVSP